MQVLLMTGGEPKGVKEEGEAKVNKGKWRVWPVPLRKKQELAISFEMLCCS